MLKTRNKYCNLQEFTKTVTGNSSFEIKILFVKR